MDSHGKDGSDRGSGRREFLRATTAGGLGIALGSAAADAARAQEVPAPATFEMRPLETVRVGMVGVGLQGTSHLQNLLRIEGVEIRAVCDVVEWKAERAREYVRATRQPEPEIYARGERDFERLCARDDLDLVITATPWRWHVPVCVAAMEAGKHAATEVPAAVTLEGCWQLVETSERTRRHCVMLENCCYSERALLMLNLVRRGVLGELIHGTGGYLHDLREIKFNGRDEALWRTEHAVTRDGNLYPTHGLGPLAVAMDVCRGDRFDHLVSMSSLSRGLNLYAERQFGPDDPAATRPYALGDVNHCLIRTALGRTLAIVHDTSSPRPYSRVDRMQGTNGVIEGYPDRIHVEGESPAHEWEPFDRWMERYGHPLWQALGDRARGAGHGGMDYVLDWRLIDAFRQARYPDMDVYDAAAWSAVAELSERSVAERSRSVDFPDFTRGRWRENPPIFAVDV